MSIFCSSKVELVGLVRLGSSPHWTQLPLTSVRVTSHYVPSNAVDKSRLVEEKKEKNIVEERMGGSGRMGGKKEESEVEKEEKIAGNQTKIDKGKTFVGEDDEEIGKSKEVGNITKDNEQRNARTAKEMPPNSHSSPQLDGITQKGSTIPPSPGPTEMNSRIGGVGDIDVVARKIEKVSEIVKASPVVASVTATDGGKFPLKGTTKVEEGKGGHMEQGGKGERGRNGEKEVNEHSKALAEDERREGLKSAVTIVKANSSQGTEGTDVPRVDFKNSVKSDAGSERGDKRNTKQLMKRSNAKDNQTETSKTGHNTDIAESSVIQEIASEYVKNARLSLPKRSWRENCRNLTDSGISFAEDDTKMSAVKVELETRNANKDGREEKTVSEDEYVDKNEDGNEDKNNDKKKDVYEDENEDEFEDESEDANEDKNTDKNEDENNDKKEDENEDGNEDENEDENEDKNENGNKDKNENGNDDENEDEYEDEDKSGEGETDEVGELRLDVSKSHIVGRNDQDIDTAGQTGMSGSRRVGEDSEEDGGADKRALEKIGLRLVGRWRREAWLDPKVDSSPVKGKLEVTNTAQIASFSPSARRKEALQSYSPSYLQETLQPFKETAGLRAALELYNPLALRKSLQPYDPPPSTTQDYEAGSYKKMSSIYRSWKSGASSQHQFLIPFLSVVFSLTCLLTCMHVCVYVLCICGVH